MNRSAVFMTPERCSKPAWNFQKKVRKHTTYRDVRVYEEIPLLDEAILFRFKNPERSTEAKNLLF